MSSPSEPQSRKSEIVSSPKATDAVYEHTASSVQGMGPPPGVAVQFLPVAPNTSFAQRMSDVRAHSVSPRPRRTISPSSLSVAQQCVRIAEQKAESTVSGVGVVAEQSRFAQSIAEAAIAEARSVHKTVKS